MPLYDFECRKCSHIFEAFLKLSEGPDVLSCPKCCADDPRKLVSNFRTNSWSTFLDKLERKISPEKFK
ncbi:MAG: zinc ribbon domain-containing protein [Syntrophales bacterium]|nr:zinc ribbon domain-containing protein [Syntrophales bacterium]